VATVEISFDAKQVRRFLDALPERLAVRAGVRALNKVAANVRTAASAGIRRRRALTASTVRQALAITRASKSRQFATITVRGAPIPLRDYAARQGTRGVTVLVTPGKRKLVALGANKAFVLDRFGGHVFARTGAARLPIKKLFGPSLPSTFMHDEVRLAWEAVARDAMLKRFLEEVRFELARASGKL